MGQTIIWREPWQVRMQAANVLPVIYELLPGFIAAWVFYGLTAYAKPDTFERVVQALIFTGISRVISYCLSSFLFLLGERFGSIGPLATEGAFALSLFSGVLVGLFASYLCNSGLAHSLLPRWLTTKTSHPSEWFTAFKETQSYVYLRLQAGDGVRTIHGWPEQWPDTPTEGHFILVNAAWIGPDDECIPLDTIQKILIPVKDVKYVEFDQFQSKLSRSTGTSAASIYNPL